MADTPGIMCEDRRKNSRKFSEFYFKLRLFAVDFRDALLERSIVFIVAGWLAVCHLRVILT